MVDALASYVISGLGKGGVSSHVVYVTSLGSTLVLFLAYRWLNIKEMKSKVFLDHFDFKMLINAIRNAIKNAKRIN